jgi:hypothetical protein
LIRCGIVFIVRIGCSQLSKSSSEFCVIDVAASVPLSQGGLWVVVWLERKIQTDSVTQYLSSLVPAREEKEEQSTDTADTKRNDTDGNTLRELKHAKQNSPEGSDETRSNYGVLPLTIRGLCRHRVLVFRITSNRVFDSRLALYNSGRPSCHRFAVAVVETPYDRPYMLSE